MKKFWKIKWENIMVIALFITMIRCWLFYGEFVEDTRALAIAIMPTIMFLFILISYNTIKKFRLELVKAWQ